MDKLLEQVAQTLKIPTDALQTVINNYPLIRQEYAVYKALDVANDTLWAVVLVNAIVTCLLAIVVIIPTDYRNTPKKKSTTACASLTTQVEKHSSSASQR